MRNSNPDEVTNADLEFEVFWRALVAPACYLVYGLYSGGELLYVGMTSRFRGRLREHFETRDWMHLVDRVECWGPYDESTARRRESELIAVMEPTYNVAGRGLKSDAWLERARAISAEVQKHLRPQSPLPAPAKRTRAELAELKRAQLERARKISAKVQNKPYQALAD